MIHVLDRPISLSTQDLLAGYQQGINGIADYVKRVDAAKNEFSGRNTANNPAFKEVKASLRVMSGGNGRCMYCEDSLADEIEHIQPKDLYPEAVFVWENYLYSCGTCNRSKSNKYAVFDGPAENITDITRKPNDPVLPPKLGDPVLINPRKEDPFILIALDLQNTFRFGPFPGISLRDQMRADYTIEKVLCLNRDMLPMARANAYVGYRSRLREYIEERFNGAPDDVLQRLKDSMFHCEHRTVWYEMKRQQSRIPELKTLFERVPEALNW